MNEMKFRKVFKKAEIYPPNTIIGTTQVKKLKL